jgi:hypothetical protein
MGWGWTWLRRWGRAPASRWAELSVVVVLLVIAGLPTVVVSPQSPAQALAAAGIAVPGTSPAVIPIDTVTIRNQTIGNLSNFWGVGLNPGYSLNNISSETQGTPVNWVVWPAGDVADSYDMTNGTLWTNGIPAPEVDNESQFVTACRAISCHAIFSVPGEINDPQFGAYEVAYTEQVLHFYPAYWEIGNEPHRWTHFNQSWNTWNGPVVPAPTPLEYAHVVQSYITTMRMVDPTLQFLGLPGSGNGSNKTPSAPDGPWLTATVEVNGPNLSGVAIHDYPGESGSPNPTLTKFFSSLSYSKTSMVNRVSADDLVIRTAESNISCSSCTIPLFIDEFGAGTRLSNWQPYMHTFAEVPYVAAQLVMMSQSNVSHADLFELRSGYNGSLFDGPGVPFPLDSLYSQIIPHYDLVPLNSTVTGSQIGVFAGASESPDSNSLTLLASNANPTTAVQLNVAGAVFPTYGSYQLWNDSNSTLAPNGVVTHTSGFESSPSWVIPPLGVILVSVCRSNASLDAGGLYPVTFCNSGLPTGKPWSVTLGGTTLGSTSGTITFPESNGTYAYQIGVVGGWSTSNRSGNLTVNGDPASVMVPFDVVTYPVTFNETGLPSGTPWSVTLDGSPFSSNTATLTGYAPNGTFPYAMGIVAGYMPNLTRGNVTVTAGPVLVLVNWSEVFYSVTFHQLGLPIHTNWSIDLAGSIEYNVTGNPIAFSEPNGTYAYTVNPITGYTPDVNGGTVTVRGYVKFVPLTWAQNSLVYPIQIVEVGLPNGTSWNATLSGATQVGTGSSFSFNDTNGTYPYTVGGTSGWAPLAYSGNITVAGGPVVFDVDFFPVTYAVTFNETGLPLPLPGGTWSVTLNSTPASSPTSNLTFLERNGTYRYSVLGDEPNYCLDNWAGWITVNGTAVNHTVAWSLCQYAVTFNETGITGVTGSNTWTLDVINVTSEVNLLGDPTWTTSLANGSYRFSASTSAAGWALLPAVQNFTVVGEALEIDVNYIAVFPVTFTESNLTTSTRWTVTLNGTNESSTNGSITFLEPVGNFHFVVPKVMGLFASPATGRIAVKSLPVLQAISFGPETWPITYSESGLPSGTDWSVTQRGHAYSGTSSTIAVWVPNGTYDYTIGFVSGWSPNSTGGSVSVAGENASVEVQWTQVFYSVTFSEVGLPAGTNWSVTLQGTPELSPSSSLVFTEPNGSYAYQIGPVLGWSATHPPGQVVVDGASVGVTVDWTQITDAVNFTETGLPVGTPWSVSVDNATPITTLGNWISVTEAPGSYSFRLGAVPGWTTTNFTGEFTASKGAKVPIHWTARLYSVTLIQRGLPVGDSWSATVNSQLLTQTTSQLVFRESNGTFSFAVQVPDGYSAQPASGTVLIAGNATQVAITITAVTNHPAATVSTFDEEVAAAVLVVVVVIALAGVVWWRSRPRTPPPAAPPPGVAGGPP